MEGHRLYLGIVDPVLFVESIDCVQIKSPPRSGAESFMPFCCNKIEERKRHFIHFILIVFHSSPPCKALNKTNIILFIHSNLSLENLLNVLKRSQTNVNKIIKSFFIETLHKNILQETNKDYSLKGKRKQETGDRK